MPYHFVDVESVGCYVTCTNRHTRVIIIREMLRIRLKINFTGDARRGCAALLAKGELRRQVGVGFARFV